MCLAHMDNKNTVWLSVLLHEISRCFRANQNIGGNCTISYHPPLILGLLKWGASLTLSISLRNGSDSLKRLCVVQECRIFPSSPPERYCWFQSYIYYGISTIMPRNPKETYPSFTFNFESCVDFTGLGITGSRVRKRGKRRKGRNKQSCCLELMLLCK